MNRASVLPATSEKMGPGFVFDEEFCLAWAIARLMVAWKAKALMYSRRKS